MQHVCKGVFHCLPDVQETSHFTSLSKESSCWQEGDGQHQALRRSGRVGSNKPALSLPALCLSSWLHSALGGKVETPFPELPGLIGPCKVGNSVVGVVWRGGRGARLTGALCGGCGGGGWSRKAAPEEQWYTGLGPWCPWLLKSPLCSGLGTLGYPCSDPKAWSSP